MTKSKMLNLIKSWQYYRSKRIIRAYDNWIPLNSKVLDISTGDGILADILQRHFGFNLLTCDIKDQRKVPVDFILVPKNRPLPFPNQKFDVCMLNASLHHCENWKLIIKEALRIGKEVLIFEAHPYFIMKIWDFISNIIWFGTFQISHFRSADEWKSLLGNTVIEYREIPNFNFAFKLKKSLSHNNYSL